MFENLAPKKGYSPKVANVRFNREMRGGFIELLIPLLASAISAAPAIASAVIQSKSAEK